MPDQLTADSLLGGRVRFDQPVDGYRAAIDPVLLAAAVPAGSGDVVLDAGSGSGAASLCLAARVPGCRVVGLEIDRSLQRLASDNVRHNQLDQWVEMIEGDVGRPPLRLAGGSFDQVMTNPPHLAAPSATPPPNPARARAHIQQLDLGGWFRGCLQMLRPGGMLTLIHRADRLAEVLRVLDGALGELVVFPLWPRAGDRPAKRILVQGRKGSRGPLRLAQGLVLHEEDGRYSAAAEAVLRHAKALPLARPMGEGAHG